MTLLAKARIVLRWYWLLVRLTLYRRTHIQPGELIPRGFGLAWWRLETDEGVVLPIPLNFLAGWIRKGWHRLKRGPKSCPECGR